MTSFFIQYHKYCRTSGIKRSNLIFKKNTHDFELNTQKRTRKVAVAEETPSKTKLDRDGKPTHIGKTQASIALESELSAHKKKELGTTRIRVSNQLDMRKSPSILLKPSPRSRHGLEDEMSGKLLDSQKSLEGSSFRKNKHHRKAPSEAQVLFPQSPKHLPNLNQPRDASITRTDSDITSKKRAAVKSKLFDQPPAKTKQAKYFKNPFEDIVLDPVANNKNIIFAVPNKHPSREKKKTPLRIEDQGEFISMTEKEFEKVYGVEFMKFVKRQETPSKPQFKSILEPSQSPELRKPQDAGLPLLNAPVSHNRSQRLRSPELQTDFKLRYNLFHKKSELYFKPLTSLKKAKEEEFFFVPNHKPKKLSLSPSRHRPLEFLKQKNTRNDSKEEKPTGLIHHEENQELKQKALRSGFIVANRRSSRIDLTAIKPAKPEHR